MTEDVPASSFFAPLNNIRRKVSLINIAYHLMSGALDIRILFRRRCGMRTTISLNDDVLLTKG